MCQESKDRAAGGALVCQARDAADPGHGAEPDRKINALAAQSQEPACGSVATRLEALKQEIPGEQFTLDWMMASLGRQSSGLLILVLALLAATPGVSVPAGLLLLFVAIQMVMGRARPDFPKWIAARPLPSRALSAILQRAIPALKLIERVVRRRGPALGLAGERVIGVTIILLTIRLLTNPLPFSNMLPALVIALISLAHLELDVPLLLIALAGGLLMLSADLVLLWKLAHQFIVT